MFEKKIKVYLFVLYWYLIAYIVFNWFLFSEKILQVDWSARNLRKMTFKVILNIFRKLQTRFRFSEKILIVLIFSGFYPGIQSANYFIQDLGISKIHENWHTLMHIVFLFYQQGLMLTVSISIKSNIKN